MVGIVMDLNARKISWFINGVATGYEVSGAKIPVGGVAFASSMCCRKCKVTLQPGMHHIPSRYLGIDRVPPDLAVCMERDAGSWSDIRADAQLAAVYKKEHRAWDDENLSQAQFASTSVIHEIHEQLSQKLAGANIGPNLLQKADKLVKDLKAVHDRLHLTIIHSIWRTRLRKNIKRCSARRVLEGCQVRPKWLELPKKLIGKKWLSWRSPDGSFVVEDDGLTARQVGSNGTIATKLYTRGFHTASVKVFGGHQGVGVVTSNFLVKAKNRYLGWDAHSWGLWGEEIF